MAGPTIEDRCARCHHQLEPQFRFAPAASARAI
jgi:ribosome-interacting GTPase 1